MKKLLNKQLYNRLLVQAQEAKSYHMDKLASRVITSLGSLPEEDNVSYDLKEVKDDIHQGMWNIATCLLKYHDISHVDIEKLDNILGYLTTSFINEIEESLDLKKIGALETKVPGQE